MNICNANVFNRFVHLVIPCKSVDSIQMFCGWYLLELEGLKQNNKVTLSVSVASITIAFHLFCYRIYFQRNPITDIGRPDSAKIDD